MQYHIVIGTIVFMMMLIPVAAVHMYLHVSHPHRIIDLYLGIKEIGTRVVVMQTRVYNLHILIVGSGERCKWKHLVFPCEV